MAASLIGLLVGEAPLLGVAVGEGRLPGDVLGLADGVAGLVLGYRVGAPPLDDFPLPPQAPAGGGDDQAEHDQQGQREGSPV